MEIIAKIFKLSGHFKLDQKINYFADFAMYVYILKIPIWKVSSLDLSRSRNVCMRKQIEISIKVTTSTFQSWRDTYGFYKNTSSLAFLTATLLWKSKDFFRFSALPQDYNNFYQKYGSRFKFLHHCFVCKHEYYMLKKKFLTPFFVVVKLPNCESRNKPL